MCSLRFSSTPQLLKHYSSVHFFEELKAKIPSCFIKAQCKLCGYSVISEKDKVAHLGFKHDKVKELLRCAGIKVDTSTGTKSNSLVPNAKNPVILHGTTKIIFEENKTIPSVEKKKDLFEATSGSKSFKLSSTVRCKVIEDESIKKNTSSIPLPVKKAEPLSTVALPSSKKLKITHNPKDATYQRITSPPHLNNPNIKDKENIPDDEDESIKKALAESLNTFQTETDKVKTIPDKSKSADKDDSFDGFKELSHRRRSQNADEPRNFRCSMCPKRYTNNSHLNDHYSGFHYKDELCKKYGKGDSLTCIFCGKTSLNRVKYAMHVGAVHQKLKDYGIEFTKKEGKPRYSK